MRTYAQRKAAAIFWNTKDNKPDGEVLPSLADQSQAHETDINVIVKRYGVHGQAPGQSGQPMYADFTEFPEGLRDMLETTRDMEKLRRQLPEQFREMPLEQLLTLTKEQGEAILNPPKPTPAQPPAPTPAGETK